MQALSTWLFTLLFSIQVLSTIRRGSLSDQRKIVINDIKVMGAISFTVALLHEFDGENITIF
jgi:hypothetical protein